MHLILIISVLFFTIVLYPTFSFGVQDIIIPSWVLKIHDYWRNQQISDDDLVNAIKYLEKTGVVGLERYENYDTQTNFLLSVFNKEQEKNGRPQFDYCTSDWYITGYFTPMESDYPDKVKRILVDGMFGEYRTGFLEEIRTEGWGKTISGNYLGWYDNGYHESNYPLDKFGNKLVAKRSVAVDSSILRDDSRFVALTLPKPWDRVIFTATDAGPSIVGNHIDVYTGEGEDAKNEAYRITGYENVLCIE